MNHFLISLAAAGVVRLSMCGSDPGTVPGQDGGADGGVGGSQCCGGGDPDWMLTDDLVPPDRLPPPGTWESAGVEGGIATRTTICADVTMAPYNADTSMVAVGKMIMVDENDDPALVWTKPDAKGRARTRCSSGTRSPARRSGRRPHCALRP